ncbi:hypothetical protein BT96DRAFT_486813 [Gymnopus androsaceus JB14]|uniref:Uncharacterized protein n=1 Tax=Gymnopus androsaceus JB14 TaxID=1447944 RepID=A0A6A4I2A6_9AGAR|nr:hypothetical protein BT96DRAFT_486813 [Gymnopus androsaceus JB14]
MLARFPFTLAAAAAFFTVASAQLQVLSPGGDGEWWVANSENLITWNCKESQEQTFTILVANPNMASALAIIAQQPNYVCSLLVTANQDGGLPAGDGYTVQFANPMNNTDVYAESSAFEIKSSGSAYPSTTVSESPSSTSSSSGSASASSSSKSNDGVSLKSSMGYATAFFGAIAGVFML